MSPEREQRWRRRLRIWSPVVLWMAVIFVGSSQTNLPTPSSSALDWIIKKGAHVLEYAVLGLLLHRALADSHANGNRDEAGSGGAPSYRSSQPALVAVLVGALFAVSDEIHQLFVPTRTGNVRDVVIDTAAIILAVVLHRLWQNRWRQPAR